MSKKKAATPAAEAVEVPVDVPVDAPAPAGMTAMAPMSDPLSVGYDAEANVIYAERDGSRVELGVGGLVYALSAWMGKKCGVPTIRFNHLNGHKVATTNYTSHDALVHAINRCANELGYSGFIMGEEPAMPSVKFTKPKSK